MTYSVKEIFYTLQGEGANAGRPAVFCRFSGCNLWSGKEQDRKTAVCRFCDTDFVGTDGVGGGRFLAPSELARAVRLTWPDEGNHPAERPLVVCTGGEPLLQLDGDLISAFHFEGLEVAVETNGTIAAPTGIDWLCVSPKASAPLVQRRGNELKLVLPQAESDVQPERLDGLDFDHFFIQPLDGPDAAANTRAAVDYCLRHPRWRLSLQIHKLVGLP